MCTHDLCFEQKYEQKYENSQTFQPKIAIFTAVKNRCMLHGHVFVKILCPTYIMEIPRSYRYV